MPTRKTKKSSGESDATPVLLKAYQYMPEEDISRAAIIFYRAVIHNVMQGIDNPFAAFFSEKIPITDKPALRLQREAYRKVIRLEKIYRLLSQFTLEKSIFITPSLPNITDWTINGLNEFANTLAPSKKIVFKSLLGKGVYGRVYQASIGDTGDFAIKIPSSPTSDTENRNRVKLIASREALFLKKLIGNDGEPENNIVHLTDSFMLGNHFIIVMPQAYSSVKHWLDELRERSPDKKLRLNFTTILSIMRQLLNAFNHLSKQSVIYGDFHSPENLLLFPGGIVRLTDFGLAQYESEPAKPGDHILDRRLQPPEHIFNLQYTGAIDRWTLGLMLVHLYTGENFGFNEGQRIYEMIRYLGMPSSDFIERLESHDRFSSFRVSNYRSAKKTLNMTPPARKVYYSPLVSLAQQIELVRNDLNLFNETLQLSYDDTPDNQLSARALRAYRLYHIITKIRPAPKSNPEKFFDFIFIIAGLLTWEDWHRPKPSELLNIPLFLNTHLKKGGGSSSPTLTTEANYAYTQVGFFSGNASAQLKNLLTELKNFETQFGEAQHIIQNHCLKCITLKRNFSTYITNLLNDSEFCQKNFLTHAAAKIKLVSAFILCLLNDDSDSFWFRHGIASHNTRKEKAYNLITNHQIKAILYEETMTSRQKSDMQIAHSIMLKLETLLSKEVFKQYSEARTLAKKITH